MRLNTTMGRRRQRWGMVVGLALMLSLAACGSDDSANGDGQSAGSASEECDTSEDTPGITDDTIKLGAFTPLTGPVGALGEAAILGQQVVFDKVNEEGGINGRKIEFVTVDDKYDPPLSQQAIRKLVLQDKVFAIAGGIGTPNMVSVLPYIDEAEIPVIAPYAPSNQVGVMENSMVYMTWPNYISEYQVVVDYIVKEQGAQKIAMLTRPDDVGQDALKGTEQALSDAGLELVDTVTVDPLTTDFTAAAQELKDSGADWVVIASQPTGVGQAIQAMKQIGYTPKFASNSDQVDQSWVDAWTGIADGLIGATKVAMLPSDDPLTNGFVDTFKAATGEEPTLWNQVGYAQSLVTVEALRNAPAMTRDCLEYSLQHMTDFETGVIPPVTFAEDSRQGTHAVGIAQLQGDAWVELAPFQPVPE